MPSGTYFSPKTKKMKSPINGQGLFATEKIFRGELVVVKFGSLVHKDKHSLLVSELGDTFLQIAEDFFIGPTTLDEIPLSFAYLNHSCEPNLGLWGQMTFYAMGDIPSGTELTFDYATSTMREFSMNCACGTKSCRKVITGNDWKNSSLQERYGNYFSSYILMKMQH